MRDMRDILIMLRHMEDFVTWVDTSKLKRTIMSYNDEVHLRLSLPRMTLLIMIFSWTTLIYSSQIWFNPRPHSSIVIRKLRMLDLLPTLWIIRNILYWHNLYFDYHFLRVCP